MRGKTKVDLEVTFVLTTDPQRHLNPSSYFLAVMIASHNWHFLTEEHGEKLYQFEYVKYYSLRSQI